MSKIRIRNFGPIKEGYQDNDGWLEISKVTVFIGNQGSGKSTLAKVISTMTWIEKGLVRGDFNQKDIIRYNRLKKQFAYQNILNYFQEETLIEYQGDAYDIVYRNGTTEVHKGAQSNYLFPKIMYVPAERNFVSTVDKPNTLKNLPKTLYTFLDELENANENIKEGVHLPINDVKFEYQKFSKIGYISGEDYKIRLSEASSGFQSLVPLYLVTRYLALSLIEEDDLSNKKNISVEEENRIRKEIKKILSNPNISEEVKSASLEFLSSRFKYSCFINIVEEPEQNLFPTSQWQMLKSLLEFNNVKKGNKLVMTTHSPFIINYLTLAVKADLIKDKVHTDEQKNKLNYIVPIKSTVNPDDLIIYELNEKDGTINRLENYHGLPSDQNKLNYEMGESNELFAQLLEIEQEL